MHITRNMQILFKEYMITVQKDPLQFNGKLFTLCLHPSPLPFLYPFCISLSSLEVLLKAAQRQQHLSNRTFCHQVLLLRTWADKHNTHMIISSILFVFMNIFTFKWRNCYFVENSCYFITLAMDLCQVEASIMPGHVQA